MPVDYKQGRIYRITCGDLTYYGSTCQTVCVRLAGHRRYYKYWKNNKKNYTSSFQLFEIGNPIITLVEDFPCERKEQLLARERFYIENNDCVNKCIPGRTKKEYNADNSEKICEHRKQYCAENSEKISEYKKQYYAENSEKISDKNKQTWTCECCNVTITLTSKSRHIKTKKHIAKLN
jgi:hypothetical protein